MSILWIKSIWNRIIY